MKTRNGFVSNSSSSSFLVLYRPAEASEIGDPHIRFMGEGINEGRDYFHVENDAIGSLIKENSELQDRLIYAYFESNEEANLTTQQLLDIANLAATDKKNYGKIKLESFEKDYLSTDQDMNYFKDTYLRE